ncbi:MAG: haloacid dehalogenase-like hydrolase [Sphaerochaetaceae bacterium]|nr:haloacid dehalogenase-like hydrolase [Sphaerochaetaceae bacterium]
MTNLFKRTTLISIIFICLIFVISCTTSSGAENIDGKQALSYWSDDAVASNELIKYIEEITDENSASFIPVKDRIAVFDFDGTLFCETDPNYFDHCLLKYRVFDDPNYTPSEFELYVGNKVKEMSENGTNFPELPVEHGQAVASAFKGFTMQEFFDYIEEFKKTPMDSYEGMSRGEGYYLPMLQIVNYLLDNQFKVYVVSGTDRFIIRGLIGDDLGIPMSQMIGSDETLVATGMGNTASLNYTFKDSDEMVFGGEFIIKNLKLNKVTVIMKEIGQQPVLAFGNSSGDAAMLMYTTTNNPYKSLAFMLCCDDLVRENGKLSSAEKMLKLSNQNGWIPVSMKNDWKTIYGDKVTKK